jgi:hypothetical protein
LWFVDRSYGSGCPTLPSQYKGEAKVLWSGFASSSYIYVGRPSVVLDQTAISLFNITGFFIKKSGMFLIEIIPRINPSIISLFG